MNGTVSLIEPNAIDNTLRKNWGDLSCNLHRPNPYASPWFLEPAMKYLGRKENVRLCVIHSNATGQLIGCLPIVKNIGYAKIPLPYMSVWKYNHAFNGMPLIRKGYFDEAYTGLLNWIDQKPEGSRFLRFTTYPFTDAADTSIRELCSINNRSHRIQHSMYRAVLTKKYDYATHMKRVYSYKKRKELKRQENRFAELGSARFEELPITEKTLDTFIALENSGWKGSTTIGTPLARSDEEQAFFREAMLKGATHNAVTCLALTLDTQPAAMLFSLICTRTLSAFKTTFNEEYSTYSPGVRLLMEATRRMLENDSIDTYDSCAREEHPVVNTLWPDRLRIAQLNLPAKDLASKVLLHSAANIEKATRFTRQ